MARHDGGCWRRTAGADAGWWQSHGGREPDGKSQGSGIRDLASGRWRDSRRHTSPTQTPLGPCPFPPRLALISPCLSHMPTREHSQAAARRPPPTGSARPAEGAHSERRQVDEQEAALAEKDPGQRCPGARSLRSATSVCCRSDLRQRPGKRWGRWAGDCSSRPSVSLPKSQFSSSPK